jgi:hypothetical protein
MKMISTFGVVLFATAMFPTVRVTASGGPGIYAIVEKVSLEPSEGTPERIQMSGAFIVPRPMSSSQYLPAQRGYLYFKLSPGREQTARIEWTDLKAVAGTGQAVDAQSQPNIILELRNALKAGA